MTDPSMNLNQLEIGDHVLTIPLLVRWTKTLARNLMSLTIHQTINLIK